MEWFWHNPVADMRGPDFLLLYGSVLLFTLLIVVRRVRRLDPTHAITNLRRCR